jgi:hypothetical protein
MRLEGSCQCGRVRFSVESTTPYPFMFCYCSICRKVTGGAFGCNIMGERSTLRVRGKRHARCYHAVMREAGKRATRSGAERWFCGECGTHLYLLDDQWPEGVWPNAGAIDSELPNPPEHVHIMTRYKPGWVPTAEGGPTFKRYPELSIAAWHDQNGLRGAVKARRSKVRPSSGR